MREVRLVMPTIFAEFADEESAHNGHSFERDQHTGAAYTLKYDSIYRETVKAIS